MLCSYIRHIPGNAEHGSRDTLFHVPLSLHKFIPACIFYMTFPSQQSLMLERDL